MNFSYLCEKVIILHLIIYIIVKLNDKDREFR